MTLFKKKLWMILGESKQTGAIIIVAQHNSQEFLQRMIVDDKLLRDRYTYLGIFSGKPIFGWKA